MIVLGIESSCDETACAIVRNGQEILSNVVSSQIDLHTTFGGVVPELACRRHIDVILPVIEEALMTANVTLEQIDLIAVTHGPGLIGALLIGLNAAKALALALDKPFIGVNHIEAHLYAALMSHETPPTFPCIGAVLSGGHTSLVKVHDIGHYETIGETVDDAVGEAFDKVAKILELPYPGGPQIEALARTGDANRYPFKGGKVKGRPTDFSFSGLKTAVLYSIKGQNGQLPVSTDPQIRADIAASFQQAALQDIVNKTLLAAEMHGCQEIIFGGGVTNNRQLRFLFEKQAANFRLLWPSGGLSLDNAAMIAGLGFHTYCKKGVGDEMSLEAATRIRM